MPASIPYTTAGEVTRNQQPRRSRPASSWMAPASSRIGPEHGHPVGTHQFEDQHREAGRRAADL